MSDIKALIEKVKAHDASAAPGPWLHQIGTVPSLLNTHGAVKGNGALVIDNAEDAVCALVVCYRTAAPILAAEVERLSAALERPTAKTCPGCEDFAADARKVLSERCAPNEWHCSCVPHLRAEIERLNTRGDQHATLADGLRAQVAALIAQLDVLTQQGVALQERPDLDLAALGAEVRRLTDDLKHVFTALGEHLRPGQTPERAIMRIVGDLAACERERDAYRKAKAENDERFQIERDEARRDRDAFEARAQAYDALLTVVALNLKLPPDTSPDAVRKALSVALRERNDFESSAELAADRANRAQAERDEARRTLAALREYLDRSVADEISVDEAIMVLEGLHDEDFRRVDRWASAMAEERKDLKAERDELRLSLLAEQGDIKGAPDG